jgi:hypothetical protein
VRDPAEIREYLERGGLGARADAVIAGLRPEIRIVATPSDELGLGDSRIGGAPDLPSGVAWPRYRVRRAEAEAWPEWSQRELAEAIAAGQVIVEGDHVALALPFIAQLDLFELSPLQSVLPHGGHLWLFADQQTHAGMLGDYPHVACTCLFAVADELVRVDPPPVPESFIAGALAFTAELALPDAASLELTQDEWWAYYEVGQLLGQPEPRHTVLPQPDLGTLYVPPPGFTPLLRVDSDAALGTTWGDAAWITFAIPEAALAAARFDEVVAFRWIG